MRRNVRIRSMQQARESARKEEKSKQKKKRFSNLFTWKKVNSILIVAIVGIIAILLIFTPWLEVKHINFDGPEYPTGVIEGVIQDQLQTNYLWVIPRSNILFFDTSYIEKAFAEHPYLTNIRVVKKFPTSLAVTYELRQPHFVVYNQNTFWNVSPDGYVLSVSDTQTATGPIIEDALHSHMVGTQILYADRLADLDLIWNTLSSQTKATEITPQRFVVTQNAKEIELYTQTGWRILFALDQNIQRQLIVLQGVIKDKITNLEDLKYIDLRVTDWVYYQ